MTDIVERLAEAAMLWDERPGMVALFNEAAAEIERLRAALQDARYVIDGIQHSEGNDLSDALADIDAALEPKP